MNIALVSMPPDGPCWIGKGAKLDAEFARYLVGLSKPISPGRSWNLDLPTANAALTIAATTLERAGFAQDEGGWWACPPDKALRACERAVALASGEFLLRDDLFRRYHLRADREDRRLAERRFPGLRRSSSSVKRWQHGTQRPDWEALARLRLLAEAMGVSLTLEDFLGHTHSAEVIDLPVKRRKAKARNG